MEDVGSGAGADRKEPGEASEIYPWRDRVSSDDVL